MTRAENVARCQELRARGLLFREIAAETGLAITTVNGYVNDPSGERTAARKAKAGGTCVGCGGPTSYITGGSATTCRSCLAWTREEIRDAVLAFYDRHGRSPSLAQHRPASAWGLPSLFSVVREWESWNAMLADLGLPINRLTPSETWPVVEGLAQEGLTCDDIAARVGTTSASVAQMFYSRGLSVPPRSDRTERLRERRDLCAVMYREGRSYSEIGDALGITTGSAANLVRRLRPEYELAYRRERRVAA